MTEKVTRNNQSADKVLDVIEAMVRNGTPMRLNDIAKQSGLPQSTAYRMVNALRERGYIIQDEDSSKYMLSMKFSLVGDMVKAKFDLRDVAHPYMCKLAEACDGISYLAVERQTELVYIDMVSPPGSVLTRMPYVGKRAPLHCGGIGMMILSDYPDSKLSDYFSHARFEKPSPKSLTNPEEIMDKIQEIRRCGYSHCTEQLESGNGSVAVGLRNHTGRVIAGISVGGPVERLTEEYIQSVLPRLQAAADEISRKLAYRAL